MSDSRRLHLAPPDPHDPAQCSCGGGPPAVADNAMIDANLTVNKPKQIFKLAQYLLIDLFGAANLAKLWHLVEMQDQRIEWLKPRMDKLFEFKSRLEAKGKDFNTSIQSGREYRNPRICEKLIEYWDIRQYGSNLPTDKFDLDAWHKKPEAFYDSRMYREIERRRDRERQAKRQS